MLTNPVVVSILLMSVLCLMRFNVMLSIIFSAMLAGILSLADFQVVHQIYQTQGFGYEMLGVYWQTLEKTMKVFIKGMSGNLEVALSYILLGGIACAIGRSHLTHILIYRVTPLIGNHKSLFCLWIALIACFSQNLIPVHIAFIPVLIPPFLALMNRMKLDRRAVASALSFGLQAPYIALPFGFGLIFHTIIRDSLKQNGVEVTLSDVASVMWIGGVAMVVGLFVAIFVLYAKPRNYIQTRAEKRNLQEINVSMDGRDYGVLFGVFVTFAVQYFSDSLFLGALVGLLTMIVSKGIVYDEVNEVMDGGMKMMSFIAFVVLVASGYASVLQEGGSIGLLVNETAGLMSNQVLSALLMLVIGLLITMGIGTSFGTIPIIATIFCPLGLALGFSTSAIILLVGIAGALGDSGSPASDSTLGPTSGLNADGQHNHIWDTCVPTFLVYNTSLIVVGVVGAVWLNG
ncbi:sodium:proton antiporter [Helicobacter enhydrae]|uniref:Sodium:proton antiporter n=1 Tax=Helicobacter enhydrae TaxID=222136 RepID=A0A1B1U7E2_9HELI|nr:sodium:proton antiporter [Helicobacter enhydrae]